MDNYTATELAYNNGYKNGYEQGKKDAVKHGEWVRQDDYFCCSGCGQSISELCVPWFKYCPKCGAKMDGGEAE